MGYGIIFMVIDMTKKYFFFDVDGTLTTQNPGGTILPSTLKTLEKLKENGHFVALATGRSYLYALDGLKRFNIEPDDKSVGIKKMMDILNAPMDDVVVFGDGHNDITMFQMAKTSIAMGNAIDQLKETATFVTKSCDEDGIEYACQHFGWIK